MKIKIKIKNKERFSDKQKYDHDVLNSDDHCAEELLKVAKIDMMNIYIKTRQNNGKTTSFLT